MELNEKIKESIVEILSEFGQSPTYEKSFIALIKNFISESYTDDDIKEMIEAIKLKEENKN